MRFFIDLYQAFITITETIGIRNPTSEKGRGATKHGCFAKGLTAFMQMVKEVELDENSA